LLVGSLKLSENIFDLVAHQQQLCVATHGGVSMYSLTHAAQPRLLHQWTDFGAAKRVFSGSKHIYVSDSFSGLRMIDPEVDTAPSFVDLNIDPRTISATSDYLFVAGSDNGLLVVDKNTSLARQVVKTINTSGYARDLYIKNRWLYIAADQGGVSLQGVDSEDGVRFFSARRGKSFTVYKDLLFVAEGKQGIEVFDISKPSHPLAVVDWPNLESLRLAVIDNYLLSVNGTSEVELIDISALQYPVRKDVLPDVHALDIASDGNLIFIASRNEGLLIYEITENSKFNRLSQLLTPFPMNQFDQAVAVQVRDGIAYVANGRSGLLIVDVSKPRKPTILSSIDIPGICEQLRVVGRKVIITSHHGGINIVNIDDPQKPILLNSIATPGLSRGLQVVDDLIYVTHDAVGVTVVAAPVMAKKVELISSRQIKVTLPSPKFPGRYSLQISNGRELIGSDGVITYR
ncbi:MAG: hypothetical protein KAG12_01780, partial [Desulfuromusa sp.]|nr:hypothetical protein [Desulfuromusa sp.]